jgi:hypothetical protein
MNLSAHSSEAPRQNASILPRLILLLLTLILSSSIMYSVMWRPGAGAFPTTLTLKAESCALLAQHGIASTAVALAGNTCSLIVPFRAHPFSHGGVIDLTGMAFNLTADQILTQQLDEPAAIQSRRYDLLMIIACGIWLLGSLAWVVKAHK